jgi:peroxiredoxin
VTTDPETTPSSRPRAVIFVGVLLAVVFCWPILRMQHGPRAAGPLPREARERPAGHRSGATKFDLLAKYLADDRRGRDPAAVIDAVSEPDSKFRVISQEHALRGQPAPPFTLFDQHGQAWNLAEKLREGPVVLVFYRNYGCDACVGRLFELNVDIGLFQALGAEVAAISDDPAELTQSRSKRFGEFSFAVLSDPDHTVTRTYMLTQPAIANEPERFLHGTFVIDRAGEVTWAQTGDSPFSPDTATLCELARVGRAHSSRQPERTSVSSEECR